MPELWYSRLRRLFRSLSSKNPIFCKRLRGYCGQACRRHNNRPCRQNDTKCRFAAGENRTLSVPVQAASIVAASTSMIGMSSWIGYTRRHWPHFRLSPFALRTTGFLQTGQTSGSSRAGEIIRQYCNGARRRAGIFKSNIFTIEGTEEHRGVRCDRIAFQFAARGSEVGWQPGFSTVQN